MKMHARYIILVLSTFLAVSASTQDTVYIHHKTVPALNGHSFVPQRLIRSPFINSAFQMHLGVESTVGLTIPAPDFLPDSIIGFDGSLVFATLGFQYNQRIKDWVSFFIRANIAIRTGTKLSSLILEGLNTVVGTETGLLFNVLKRPKHQMSGMITLNNYSGTIVNLNKFVHDIIDGVPNPSLTSSAPAFSVGAGVSYAYGITEVTGLAALLEIQFGENISRGNEALRIKTGAALDFNWATKGVPIGVSVAYLLRSTADYVYTDNNIGHSLAAKIAYTATPDFVIGFDISSSIVPLISVDDNAKTIGFMLNVNYYFN